MEIVAEINKEEYRLFVKNYYLEKNWVRWVAFLVIVALIISALIDWPYYAYRFFWISLYSIFSVIFSVIALMFFAIPYVLAYNTVRLKLKREDDQTGVMVYQVTDAGITVAKNGVSMFYLWGRIHKVKMLTELIVFISINNDLLIVPLRSLPNSDSESLLGLINGYGVFKTVLTKEKGIN